MKIKLNRFMILGILIVLLLGILFVPFYKGTNLVTVISQKKDYFALSEERQELFDKMKIEYLNIKSRVTGTEPFNTGDESNQNGIDVSASDDYVRTFDVMKYTVELGVGPNTGHDGVTTSSVFEGGVIKVRAKLPNQGSPTLMRWEQDAWMQNVTYSNDKTEIYAEYHVPSGVSITNANQNLTFTVKVDGYKKEVTSEMAPEFEVWMEGNKPDDVTSSASSISEKDDGNIIISGKVNLDARINNEDLHLYRNVVDGHEGRYDTFGLAVAMYQPYSNISDLRGVEYPSGTIQVELDARYKALDILNGSSTYQEITSTTDKSLGILNGTFVNVHTHNCQTADFYPKRASLHINSYPAGIRGAGFADNRSVLDTGNVTISIEENRLKFTFDNYGLAADAFPNTTTYSTTSKIASNTGYFLVEAFQLFMPLYDYSDSTSYDYTYTMKVDKITCKDTVGNDYSVENGNDALTSNNTNSLSFSSRPKGNFYLSVGLSHGGNANWRDGKASAMIGEEVVPSFNFYALDGPYDYADRLISWDSSMVSIKKYNSSKWIHTTFADGGKAEYISYKYGVYKNDPDVGVVGLTSLNSITFDDFDWYDTAEDAMEHGKIAAVHAHDSFFQFKSSNNVHIRFIVDDNEENIGKVAVFRQHCFAQAGETSFHPYNRAYRATAYDSFGNVSLGHSPSELGESLLILGTNSSVSLEPTDTDSSGSLKSAYDVQDGEIHWKVHPTLSTGAASDSDHTVDSTSVTVTLPNGLSYHNGSSNKTPKSVTVNSDGTTTIIWEYQNWQINHDAPEYPDITFTSDISASLENNASLSVKAVIFTEEDIRDEKLHRTSQYGVVISNLAGSKALKDIDKPLIEIEESFQVTSTLGNNSEEALRNVKTIEILPTNHDENGSIFSGNYTSKITSGIENQKFFYTTRNISVIGLTEDKYGKITISEVDLENDNRWTEVNIGETIPNNATAVATLIPTLPSQSEGAFVMEVSPSGNKEADTYAFTLNMTSDNLQAAIKTNTVITKVVSRKISGKAFVDEDRNGNYGEGDTLLKNHVVKLLNSSGEVIQTTQTNNNGEYEFLNVERGRYFVEFSIPDNYETIPKGNSSKANSNGRTDLITSLDVNPTTEVLEVKNIDMGIRKIDAKIHVSYVEYGNTTNVFDSKEFDKYYGDSYNLDQDYTPNIPDNYEFKEKTNNYAGTVNSKNINIIYYYQKKDSTLTSSITKNGTDKIEEKDEQVSYKITYKTKINDYLGSAIITIKDTLPYEISVSDSNLDGGVYDSVNHTITWTINKNITSITEPEITVEKNIKLKYLNIDSRSREMINTVEGKVTLDNNERSVENQFLTEIQIPGKITVRYIEVDEKGIEVKEITNSIIKTGLVGEEYTSEEKVFEGYDLIKKPETEEYEFLEEEQVVTYQYLKKKVHVETITHGIGGKIIGDEDVYYGDNSTKNKIIIEADDGYQIESIKINGEEIEVKGIHTRMVLDNFEGMIEDKLIEVSFKKLEKIINPATGTIYTIISIFGVMMILIGFFYYKKKKV